MRYRSAMPDGTFPSLRLCGVCKQPLVHEKAKYCSKVCNWRAQDHRRAQDPDYVVKLRRRLRKRYAEDNGEGYARPALAGAPPYADHLPGGITALELEGHAKLSLRDTRMLHGALSHILGVPHSPNHPDFALFPAPTSSGWAVYWWSEGALALAGTKHACRIGTTPVQLTIGALAHRIKAPPRPRRGWHTLRVSTITPVSIRVSNEGVTGTRPAKGKHMASSLYTSLAERLRCADRTMRDAVLIEEVEVNADAAAVRVGKIGVDKGDVVEGWEGEMIVRANAPARWLLECAARGPGLGGRTAFGFGRIRVHEVK